MNGLRFIDPGALSVHIASEDVPHDGKSRYIIAVTARGNAYSLRGEETVEHALAAQFAKFVAHFRDLEPIDERTSAVRNQFAGGVQVERVEHFRVGPETLQAIRDEASRGGGSL